MSSHIPGWPFRFLRWICPDRLCEEIEGDLIQKYHRDTRNFGEKRARQRLMWNVVRFFRPGIVMRNRFSIELKQAYMIQNYLKTTVRHISKSKVNFAFKLGGLSLAMFSFLAISLYVSYQLSYDKHHYAYENLYRVNSNRKENGVLETYAFVPLATGSMLKQYLPEVETFARIRFANGAYLHHDQKVTECGGLIQADTSFFHVLTYNFIAGDADALKAPRAIVLTKTKALELFGRTDVLQQMVTINHEPQPYQITGVIEDPTKTCFGFEAVTLNVEESAFTLSSVTSPTEFLDQSTTLFVRLKQPVTSSFKSKVESLLDRYLKKSDREETGFDLEFQPIKDVYLGPQLKAEFARKGNPVYVYAFSVLGILLLVVAAINYINLSIADFSNRSRETGVRKVLGARKSQITAHIIIETIVYSLLALSLGILMLYILFPQIQEVMDSRLQLSMLLDKTVVTLVLSGIAILVFFSAYFPALQFSTTHVLQNLKSKGAQYNSFLSRALLFTQFIISAICICCTVMMDRQIGFIHNKELGFDKNNLLVLSMPEDFTTRNMQVFKQSLKEIAGVSHVSNSSFRVGGGYWKDWYTVESENGMKNVELYEVFSDDELFSTLGIKVLKGRTFSANIPYDSGAAFVINETAAKQLGWDDPIGKRIYTHPEEKGKWDGTVVGLVTDVNISPLYEKVQPLVMRLPWQNEYPEYFVYVRYQGDAKAIVKAIEDKYHMMMPGYPLAYNFTDKFYDETHEKENKAFASIRFATLIIVGVSVLGIFSLAAYMSVRRMKEFGIRKVLGATLQQIASLHLGYFLKIVWVANIVAIPLSWWLTTQWLNTFAYRVALNLLPFIVVVVLSFFMVIIAGGYSAWKSGRMNPVDVIKME